MRFPSAVAKRRVKEGAPSWYLYSTCSILTKAITGGEAVIMVKKRNGFFVYDPETSEQFVSGFFMSSCNVVAKKLDEHPKNWDLSKNIVLIEGSNSWDNVELSTGWYYMILDPSTSSTT